MPRLILLQIILILFLCSTIGVADDKVLEEPKNGVFKFDGHEGFLQLPENYTSDKKHPFILFFYGHGGSVTLQNFISPEFAKFRKLCSERGVIVAVPGYGSSGWMNERAEQITLKMVDHLELQLSIDPKRFYVMGVSMGGGSALAFTSRHPEKVQAVCDVFGITDYAKFYNAGFYNSSLKAAYGGSPQENPQYYRDRSAIHLTSVLKTKPVLVLHGDKDRVVPIENSTSLVNKLKAEGGNVDYIMVPGINHSNAIIKGQESKVLDFFLQNTAKESTSK